MRIRPLTFILLGLCIALPLTAQLPPSHQRGVTADTAYQIGDLDQINLFNGSLTVSLPIGITYPVGPSLSFSLTASYSSGGWEYDENHQCQDINPPFALRTYSLPIQDLKTQAGFGWRVSLGELIAPRNSPTTTPEIYVDPSGGEHRFYTELHPGGFPATPQPSTWFTNDSTYLRLRKRNPGVCELPSGTFVDQSCYTVEFSGGELHEFHNYASVGDLWRLTRMEDRFGNWINVRYANDGDWTLTDSQGRTHTVDFVGGRVATVRLEAFGSQSNSTFLFQYRTETLERQFGFRPGCVPIAEHTLTTQVLDRVVLPDGSFYEMDYLTVDNLLSGGLSKLRLPTGGAYGYDYQLFPFQTQLADLFHAPDWGTVARGVKSKHLFLDDGDTTPYATWSYTYDTANPQAPGDPLGHPCFHSMKVTDPLGFETVSYFSTVGANNRWSYGLPYTYCDPISGSFSEAGPFLSQELFNAGGTKLRSIFVEFDSDGRDAGNYNEKAHRLRYRKETFHDDGGKFREVTFSDFDGLGHFRTMTTGGNFGAADVRTSSTTYNPNSGTYIIANPDDSSIDPATDFVLPSHNARWILETWDEQSVSEGGTTEKAEFCFNSTTGFLERRRQLAGSNRQSRDVVSLLTSSNGFVTRQRVYGGDTQNLGTGSLCSLSLSGPTYRTDHVYASGSLRKSTAVDCTGTAILTLADYDIDSDTGLVATSRDAAGLGTSFTYDRLGRLTGQRPAELGWTQWTYTLPTTANPSLAPKLTEQQCQPFQTSCSGTDLMSFREHRYDGLGRRLQETVRIPVANAGQTELWHRYTTWNPRHWKTDESVWTTASAAGESRRTTYLAYDRFGRPGRVKPPEQPATFFTYQGDRVQTRRFKVQLTSGQQDTYVTEIMDGQGRLAEVCEGSSAAWSGSCGGGGLLTRYSYDDGGRLTKVCQNLSGSTCGQTRLFDYDGRGFLLSETHPEIGPSGNGRIDYRFDAGGNATSKDLIGSTAFDLSFDFDAAGRLIRVLESSNGAGSTPRLQKQFRYARANSGSDHRAGKLVQTVRHNWVDIQSPLAPEPGSLDVKLSESFRYTGRQGLMSEKQTRYQFFAGNYAFTTGFAFDTQGNLSQLDYPSCQHADGGCATNDPQRTVNFNYEKGMLRSVPGFANNLTYQSGGMLHQLAHSDGVVDSQEVSSLNGLARPHQLTTSAGWSSGNFAYDGAGNISAIGNLAYRYDRLGRLISGQTSVGATLFTQTASFDNFGNIQQLSTPGFAALNLNPSATTNRLGLSGAQYDAAGNLTDITLGSESFDYAFDGANMMKHLRSNTDQARVFIYNASDERILTFDCFGPGATSTCTTQPASLTWTLRGLGNEVLRVYDQPAGGAFSWSRDYVHRGGQPLATIEPDGSGGEMTSHLHLDHLGTPRQITRGGQQVALHNYFPFGQEATSAEADEIQLKFTGHERDKTGTGSRSELDYMHARHCSPVVGRFLSVDPSLGSRSSPQSWNRFSYVSNSPINQVDPDGRLGFLVTAFLGGVVDVGIQIASNALSGEELTSGVAGAFVTGAVAGATGLGLLKVAGRGAKLVGAVRNAKKLKKSTAAAGAARAGARGTAGVDDLIRGATKGKTGRSRQFGRNGGIDQANKDFDSLVGSGAMKSQGGGIRSAKLPDGSTISVRPGSTQGSPTIQINPPAGKPIKVRYEE